MQLEQVQCRAAMFTFTNYRDRTPGCVETMLRVRELGWGKLEGRTKASRLVMLHILLVFNWQACSECSQ